MTSPLAGCGEGVECVSFQKDLKASQKHEEGTVYRVFCWVLSMTLKPLVSGGKRHDGALSVARLERSRHRGGRFSIGGSPTFNVAARRARWSRSEIQI